MIDQLIQDVKEQSEKTFYDKKFSFSYSSLSKLLWNPVAFYHIYVLGLREERITPSLLNGKVIHALLLSIDVFNEMFIISPDSLPTGNTKTVIDRVFNHSLEIADGREKLEDFENAIIDVLSDMNLHQSLKTDKQRIEKIITTQSINYWEFLKKKGNKELIDQDTYNYCNNAAKQVKDDEKLVKLLGFNVTQFDNIEVYNEYYVEHNMTSFPFGLKGIIDNLVINHDERVIYINDIKTSSKDLVNFTESIEYYSYWMQAAIYTVICYLKYSDLIAVKNYSVKFHFIVIDQNFLTYAFPVSNATIEKWIDQLTEKLKIAEYHYTNKKYELPYLFCTGKMIL